MSQPTNVLATLLANDSIPANNFVPGMVVGAFLGTLTSCCGMLAIYLCQRLRHRGQNSSLETVRHESHELVNPRKYEVATSESCEEIGVQCDFEKKSSRSKKPAAIHTGPEDVRSERVQSVVSVYTNESSHAYYASEFDPPPSAFHGRSLSDASTMSLAGANRTSIELSRPSTPREVPFRSPASPHPPNFPYMQQSSLLSPLRSPNGSSFKLHHRQPSAESQRHVLPSRASSFNSVTRSARMSAGSFTSSSNPNARSRALTDGIIPPLPKSPISPPPEGAHRQELYFSPS